MKAIHLQLVVTMVWFIAAPVVCYLMFKRHIRLLHQEIPGLPTEANFYFYKTMGRYGRALRGNPNFLEDTNTNDAFFVRQNIAFFQIAIVEFLLLALMFGGLLSLLKAIFGVV